MVVINMSFFCALKYWRHCLRGGGRERERERGGGGLVGRVKERMRGERERGWGGGGADLSKHKPCTDTET